MYLNLKTTAAIVGSFMLGAGAMHALHAQSKPPAFVVAEVDVKDKAGFEETLSQSGQEGHLGSWRQVFGGWLQ